MSKSSILDEFRDYLKRSRKVWLSAIIIFLVLFGVLILATEGSGFAPFIYTLF